MIITIIDYNCGNIFSLSNALEIIKKKYNITYEINYSNNKSLLKKSDLIIFPGVGAFSEAYQNLAKIPDLINDIKYLINDLKKPFLGICVGMQLLADYSSEGKEKISGLGIIKGNIDYLGKYINIKQYKVPHMGWNNIKITNKNSRYYEICNDKDFYFLHSYFYKNIASKYILASSHYGLDIPAIIQKENVIATQFHPEKSGHNGLYLLYNIIKDSFSNY